MIRLFALMMLAALAFAASCNGTSSTTDGGGGSTGAGGGHAGEAGGAIGGTGGHGTGGQGGIDNLCLSDGQSCGASGPMCCSGLICCYGSNGQASCVPGSCTGAQGGHSGAGAAGGAGGSGATGGAGGQGGAQGCFPNGTQCSSANQCCSFTCAGVCTMLVSDRNMKRDFAPVNDDEVLKAVDALPISSWSYKGDGTNARHLGPMAQDFMSAFHLGSNDKTILQVDGDGVSLAAIKALSQRVKDLEVRNRSLEDQVSALRAQLPRSHRSGENHRPSAAP
jgi:hypothetical protein